LERYEQIELPEIRPDATRVVLFDSICPCCSVRFKAKPPLVLDPGSLFGPSLLTLQIFLHTVHAISFERLARLAGDLLGLQISEGALVNVFSDSSETFSSASNAIRNRLLPPVRRDQRACRQEDLVDLGVPSRRLRLVPYRSVSYRPAARTWSRAFSVTIIPTSGSPTGSPPRWAGRKKTIRSALLT
jgi:hypothetical protein